MILMKTLVSARKERNVWYDNDNVHVICPNLGQERFSIRQEVELKHQGWMDLHQGKQ